MIELAIMATIPLVSTDAAGAVAGMETWNSTLRGNALVSRIARQDQRRMQAPEETP
jgi:hypothetical protein